jgi:glutamate dehydrogenase (NADP+)
MLADKGDSLRGKRCMIMGSGKVAQNVASKLLEYGAVPITFSDQTGHIYEPDGFEASKLRTVQKVKSERGAKVGRYIIASTTCQYNDPPNLFDVPCDLVFPCAQIGCISAEDVKTLSDNGCEGIIEGGHCSVAADGRKEMKKAGML